MTLLKLKAARIVVLEDYENTNHLPLIQELIPQDKTVLHMFCYEQPISLWKNVFKHNSRVIYHQELNVNDLDKYTSETCSILIDSVNQISLSNGWTNYLKVIKHLKASSNVIKLIFILHVDCLSSVSKLRINLNHIANAVITYNSTTSCQVHILMKKSGKVVKCDEMLTYDTKTSTLKLMPIVKDKGDESEPVKPEPEKLTTFKIEVDQTDKLEKYKLKLPYMSKINQGESKIYYEPDAVDDWDEEDPDEDLDL
ncbi:unnamed protein product [Chilo suppressalis]|uniref:Elongator complex protein 5 n=1 Tax=Chilo suppressalis TaxID=168631 RepID=A0ABN8B1J6_CHISP|nr:unnamed protein product [Chilo suppressalis]